MTRLVRAGLSIATVLHLSGWAPIVLAQPPGAVQPAVPTQPAPTAPSGAPEQPLAEPARAPAQIAVRSNVPAAEVLIDGVLVGRTPLANALALPPGDHVLELRRRGYRDVRRPLTLAEGGRSVLTVELFEDPTTPASEMGTLAVSVSEDSAVLLVDGQAKTIHRDSGLAFTATRIPGLPMGPHVLRVERAGFLPAEHLVVVPGGQTTTVRVTLQPTQDTHYYYVQRANTARAWAVAAVSAGFAVALAGGTLALTRHLSLDEARRYLAGEQREQDVPMNGGECDRSLGLSEEMALICDDRLQAAHDGVRVRERLRLAGFVGVGVGLLAMGTGVFFLANGDDPRKYDGLTTAPSPRRFWASGWASPTGGGGLLLGGRF